MDLDCRSCDEQLQKERGCNSEGIMPFYIEDERYFRCPKKLITPLSWEYIQAYSLYQKNMLPNGAAWINENQRFLDAMETIRQEVSRIESEKIEKTIRKK